MAMFKFLSSSVERKLVALGKSPKMARIMNILSEVKKGEDSKPTGPHWVEFKKALEDFGFTFVYDRNLVILTAALFAAIARSQCETIYELAKYLVNTTARKVKNKKRDSDEVITLGQALLDGDGAAIYAILNEQTRFKKILDALNIDDSCGKKYINRMRKITSFHNHFTDSYKELQAVKDAFTGMTHIEYNMPQSIADTSRSIVGGKPNGGEKSVDKIFNVEPGEPRSDRDGLSDSHWQEIVFNDIKSKFYSKKYDLLEPGVELNDKTIRVQMFPIEPLHFPKDATPYEGDYPNFTVFIKKLIDHERIAKIYNDNVKKVYYVYLLQQEILDHYEDSESRRKAVVATYVELLFDTIKNIEKGGKQPSIVNVVSPVLSQEAVPVTVKREDKPQLESKVSPRDNKPTYQDSGAEQNTVADLGEKAKVEAKKEERKVVTPVPPKVFEPGKGSEDTHELTSSSVESEPVKDKKPKRVYNFKRDVGRVLNTLSFYLDSFISERGKAFSVYLSVNSEDGDDKVDQSMNLVSYLPKIEGIDIIGIDDEIPLRAWYLIPKSGCDVKIIIAFDAMCWLRACKEGVVKKAIIGFATDIADHFKKSYSSISAQAATNPIPGDVLEEFKRIRQGKYSKKYSSEKRPEEKGLQHYLEINGNKLSQDPAFLQELEELFRREVDDYGSADAWYGIVGLENVYRKYPKLLEIHKRSVTFQSYLQQLETDPKLKEYASRLIKVK